MSLREVKMPDLSTTESQVKLLRWIVEVGQNVKRGQPLAEVETDKATMEVEAIATGVLEKICASPNQVVGIGEVIAIIQTSDIAASNPANPPIINSVTADNNAAQSSTDVEPTPVQNNELSLSNTQIVLGKRMQQSKQQVPHFYLQTSFNAEHITHAREAAIAQNPSTDKPVWDVFIARAIAKAIVEYDRASYRINENRLVRSNTDAVGVAVDIEGELYVVALTKPLEKSTAQLSQEIRKTVTFIQSGNANAKKLQPTCITISNLGGRGIDSFIPIINPPEAAILGVGRIAAVPVVVDNKIVIQQRANLTLAVDHRVINGRYAADFLAAIVRELESL
jgi:pyruvate dehydrogenase E2 component (dihydrolipoamide acetyltransferase)